MKAVCYHVLSYGVYSFSIFIVLLKDERCDHAFQFSCSEPLHFMIWGGPKSSCFELIFHARPLGYHHGFRS